MTKIERFTRFNTRLSPFIWAFNIGLFTNMAIDNAFKGNLLMTGVDVVLVVLSYINARQSMVTRDRARDNGRC